MTGLRVAPPDVRTIAWGAVLMLALWVPSATASPVLFVSPPTSTATVGDPLSLAIDIGGASDLYAFQFDIVFNPAVLQATDIVEGSFLPSGGSTFYLAGAIDNTLGTIVFTADTLETAITGVSGNGTLATIDFAATAAGLSPISITNVLLTDSGNFPLDFTTTDGSVTVGAAAPVPEPATLTMFGMGILGMLIRRHKVRQLKGHLGLQRRAP